MIRLLSQAADSGLLTVAGLLVAGNVAQATVIGILWAAWQKEREARQQDHKDTIAMLKEEHR